MMPVPVVATLLEALGVNPADILMESLIPEQIDGDRKVIEDPASSPEMVLPIATAAGLKVGDGFKPEKFSKFKSVARRAKPEVANVADTASEVLDASKVNKVVADTATDVKKVGGSLGDSVAEAVTKNDPSIFAKAKQKLPSGGMVKLMAKIGVAGYLLKKFLEDNGEDPSAAPQYIEVIEDRIVPLTNDKGVRNSIMDLNRELDNAYDQSMKKKGRK